MAEKWMNTFVVGIYKCELTYSERRGLHAKWSPGLPIRKLSKQEMNQYTAGRDALLSEVATHLGWSIAVVET